MECPCGVVFRSRFPRERSVPTLPGYVSLSYMHQPVRRYGVDLDV